MGLYLETLFLCETNHWCRLMSVSLWSWYLLLRHNVHTLNDKLHLPQCNVISQKSFSDIEKEVGTCLQFWQTSNAVKHFFEACWISAYVTFVLVNFAAGHDTGEVADASTFSLKSDFNFIDSYCLLKKYRNLIRICTIYFPI